MRECDRGIALARTSVEPCHDLWVGALGDRWRNHQSRAHARCGRLPRPSQIGLSSPRRPRTYHGLRTDPFRSEEHTSELQSLMRISYAVFCLKKNKSTL